MQKTNNPKKTIMNLSKKIKSAAAKLKSMREELKHIKNETKSIELKVSRKAKKPKKSAPAKSDTKKHARKGRPAKK